MILFMEFKQNEKKMNRPWLFTDVVRLQSLFDLKCNEA